MLLLENNFFNYLKKYIKIIFQGFALKNNF